MMADDVENQASSSNARGKTWSEAEELALLNVYFEEEIQMLVESLSRNSATYRRVAEKLKQEHGIDRTAKECQTKINNLKSWYRKQTDRAGKPGKSGGDIALHFIFVNIFFRSERSHIFVNCN